jgi:hypothetical protein
MTRKQHGAATKAGLAVAKANGVRLGKNGKTLAAKHKAEAMDRLAPVADLVRSLRSAGLSMRKMADTLNAAGIPSPGGGRWHIATVQRALRRLENPQPPSRPRQITERIAALFQGLGA